MFSDWVKVVALLAALTLVLRYYTGAASLGTTGGNVFSQIWRAVTGENSAGTGTIGYAK